MGITNLDALDLGTVLKGIGSATAALLLGSGTSSNPETSSAADKNFLGFWVSNSAASGTTRGMYLRLYLTGGAGGEALRAFNTVSNNAPVDTVNGAHISLNFGASAGNVTGLGTALRATLHVPDRSLGGTTAAVQAELYTDGASAALGGVTSFLRAVADGAGKAAIDTSGYLFEIAGLTPATGKLCYIHTGTAPANTNGSLRIRIGSTSYYIMLYAAEAP